MEYIVEKCLEMLPKRFHKEFVDEVIVDEYSIQNLRKVFEYYISEIFEELTDVEKEPLYEDFFFIELK